MKSVFGIIFLTLTFFFLLGNAQEEKLDAFAEKIASYFRDKIGESAAIILFTGDRNPNYVNEILSGLHSPVITYSSKSDVFDEKLGLRSYNPFIALIAEEDYPEEALLEGIKNIPDAVKVTLMMKRDLNSTTLNNARRRRLRKDVYRRIRFVVINNNRAEIKLKMSSLDRESKMMLLSDETATLTACSFHFPPFILVDEFDGGYSGVEPRIFVTIAESLGFAHKIQPPSDGGMWGDFDDENKTGYGLRKDVVDGKVDVGFAQIFTTEKVNRQLDITYPYDHDGYCWFVTKPPPLSKWYGVVRPLSVTVWIFLIISITASLLFFALYCTLHPNPEYSFGESALILWALLLLESVPIKLKSVTIHFYVVPFLLASMVLMTIYSSSLVSFLTIEIPQTPLDTLADLDARFSGKLGAMGNFDEMRDSADEVHRRLYERYEIYTDQECALRAAGEGKMAIAESKTFLQYKLRQMFTNEFGESSMHIMKECWNYFPIGFVLPKASPHTESFSYKIHQLKEAGLIDKWKRDEVDKVQRSVDEANHAKITLLYPLSMDDMQVPFFLLGISYIVCLLVFILENLCSKKSPLG